MSRQTKLAVVLLSGGLDSATVLAVAKRSGFEPHAISFAYGQRHSVELAAAKALADSASAPHRIVTIEAGFSGSALTGDSDVPKDRTPDEMLSGVPSTYVPARNMVFLSLAVSYAETIGASDVFIGVNAVDYSGYPDCRPEFIRSFERAAALGTRKGKDGKPRLTIHAPLIALSKADIIRLGTSLGVDYSLTHSCYDPAAAKACGRCDSCSIRLAGFKSAGLSDPAQYVSL